MHDIELGRVIKLRKEFIEIDDSLEYKRCRVQSHRKGVVLRDTIYGRDIKTKKQQLCKIGDFIVAEIDAKVGGYGFIPSELDGAIVSSHYFLFELNHTQIDKDYLNFLIKTDILQTQIQSQGSTNYAAIRPKHVLSFIIPLPPLETQKEIVSYLDNFSNNHNQLSSELDAQLNHIQLLRQTILQEAVQGQLVPQDPSDEPASELIKKIQAEKEQLIMDKKIKKPKPLPPITDDEIPYELPQGWVWCRLGDICRLITDGKHGNCTDEAESGYYFLSAKNIRDGYIDYSTARQITYEDFLETHKRTDLEAGDICMICTGATVGRLTIAIEDEKTSRSTFQKSVAIIKAYKEYINVNYLASYLKGMAIIFLNKSGGSAINNLLLGDIKKYTFPLPPLEEQLRIVTKVEQLMQLCDDLEAQVQQSKTDAEQLLQSVLREAFEGDKIEESITIASEPEEKAFLKRKILGSYIINQSLNDDQFGDVKFEKLLHLADYHALKRNLNQKYFQQAAGPYDNAFTIPFFKQLDRDKWFTRIKEGKRFHFSEGINHNKSLNTYGYFSDEELNKINTLVGYFNKSNYEQPEIVSTLYAVWNNRIIQKQPITDEILIKDFYNWDKEKKKYKWERLVKALTWMRDVELVPDGWGKIITKKIKNQ